jgi:hypothetical protein
MSRPNRQIGRRIGLAATFLVVGPIAGGLTFPLVVVIDHLIWPDNPARFALAGMLLAGTVLTILPSLIAGIAGAITSRLWRRRTSWITQAVAIGTAMSVLEGVLLAILSGSNSVMFQTTEAMTRSIVLIVMLGFPGALAGLAAAVATQAWRPKSLSGLYAETFD